MPTDKADPPDLLVIQGEARRGLVSRPTVAAVTAAGPGLSVMLAEADSKLALALSRAVPTDTAVLSDCLARKGEARW